MNLGRSLSFVLLSSLVVAVSVGGCDSSQGVTRTCSQGALRCSCYPNGTCNDGLECRSEVCVAATANTGGGGGELGGASSNGGNTGIPSAGGTSGSQGGAPSGGTDPGTNVGQGGTSTILAQGGTTSGETGGTTSGETGGTTSGETGGTTSGETGGTTPVATGGMLAETGGTTQVATGGTTQVATGGKTTVATGGGGGATVLGPNLVSNGDFAQGTSFWHVADYYGDELATGSVVDGSFCVTGTTTQYIGWPVASLDAVTLEAASYSMTFRAKASSSDTISAKVGLFASPYTAIYQSTAASVSSSWQDYHYTFSVSSSLSATNIGIVFTVTSPVCVDDVVLAKILSS
jgi:hypothetical protein